MGRTTVAWLKIKTRDQDSSSAANAGGRSRLPRRPFLLLWPCREEYEETNENDPDDVKCSSDCEIWIH